MGVHNAETYRATIPHVSGVVVRLRFELLKLGVGKAWGKMLPKL